MDVNITQKRLNKFLADSGYCSRREADRLIAEGRVTINGKVGVLGDQVAPGSTVLVDAHPLTGTCEKVYIALNKPIGIVCTADPREPLNVVDYLNYPRRVFPIGRLDKDSCGLLLLTSDGEIVNRVLRAAGAHEKEYIVAVDKAITDEFIQKMSSGVEILGRMTLPCRIERLTVNSFRLVLVQGLNRQIRRMCESLDYRVRSLKRVRIMNITLGDLKSGEWRLLTGEELKGLFAALGTSQDTQNTNGES